MNKKREALYLGIFLFVIILLFSLSSFVVADTNSTNSTNSSGDPLTTTTPESNPSPSTSSTKNLTGFDKSYQCLKDQINTKGVSSLTTEELAFSLLALGYDSSMKNKVKNELELRAKDGACWPKEDCKLRETSIVLMAYDNINKDTKKIEEWLLAQAIMTKDLVWYLQIDTDKDSSCSISVNNATKKFTLKADRTVVGSAGSCFRLAYNGYWLEIAEECYDKDIKISCDNDFLTSVIYKKKGDNIIFVSTKTNTASPNGETQEKVESRCFKQGTSCNYEGSLWASVALQKKAEDTSKYLPYLMALSTSNEKVLPSAFLYSLTGFDQYYNELVNQQNTKGYWQLTEASKRYYDTSIALFGLSSQSSEASTKAIDYLLSPEVQGNGCWNGNNIRDTSFLLFAASPKLGSPDTGPTRSQCNDFPGYSCLSLKECENIKGEELSNFYCFGGEICCSKKVVEKTCSEKDGKKCLSSEKCTGTTVSASDTGLCCLDGECEKESEDECSPNGAEYTCKSQCFEDETDAGYSCPENGSCCRKNPEEEKSYWWLWLLIILIILLILAIIFRNQLKVWFFRVKSKFSKSPPPSSASQSRPFPPMPPQRPGMMPRRIIPGMPGMSGMPPRPPFARPMQRPFPKDRELDETLRKLKDMSGK